MPSLTPLHFERQFVAPHEDIGDFRAVEMLVYGEGRYVTDCGRFVIIRNRPGLWKVTVEWYFADMDIGVEESKFLEYEAFPTRRDALHAIRDFCDEHGLEY